MMRLMAALMVLLLIPGCAALKAPSFTALPSEGVDVAKALAQSALAQTVWDNMTGDLDFVGHEPGIVAEHALVHRVSFYLKGVHAKTGWAGQGHGSGQLTPEDVVWIRNALHGEDERVRQLIEKILKLEPGTLAEVGSPPTSQPSNGGDKGATGAEVDGVSVSGDGSAQSDGEGGGGGDAGSDDTGDPGRQEPDGPTGEASDPAP